VGRALDWLAKAFGFQGFVRAKKSRAKILEESAGTFCGDRRYGAADPEGHQWSFAQHIHNVSNKEMPNAMNG
jgi:hypothetical protein